VIFQNIPTITASFFGNPLLWRFTPLDAQFLWVVRVVEVGLGLPGFDWRRGSFEVVHASLMEHREVRSSRVYKISIILHTIVPHHKTCHGPVTEFHEL